MLEIKVVLLTHCSFAIKANEALVLIYTYLSVAVPTIKCFFM